MFNIGTGEIALIAVVALLVLGPSRLPELARGIGKFMREFRRQTDEVRGVVEREFYKMDSELSIKEPPLSIHSAPGSVPHRELDGPPPPLPLPPEVGPSQLTAGMPQAEASPSGPGVSAQPAESSAAVTPEVPGASDPAVKS